MDSAADICATIGAIAEPSAERSRQLLRNEKDEDQFNSDDFNAELKKHSAVINDPAKRAENIARADAEDELMKQRAINGIVPFADQVLKQWYDSNEDDRRAERHAQDVYMHSMLMPITGDEKRAYETPFGGADEYQSRLAADRVRQQRIYAAREAASREQMTRDEMQRQKAQEFLEKELERRAQKRV